MKKPISKGQIFYSCWVNIEASTKSLIEFEEWHVSNIDKNGINLIQKNFITYGKLSTKHGDFGFLKNIPSYYRKKIESPEQLKEKLLFKTKSEAYRSTLPELQKLKKDISRLLNFVEKKVSLLKK